MVSLISKYKLLIIFVACILVLIGFYFYDKQPNNPQPTPGWGGVSKECKIGGCSGELCLGKNAEDVASICLYKNEYACYKNARCEVQSNGRCGWTMDSALTTCIKQQRSGSNEPIPL